MSHYSGSVPDTRRAVADLTAVEVERFWSKVQKSHPAACWLWTKGTNNRGYGRFETWHRGHRQRFLAHRVAYEIVGRKPIGASVLLHGCDTPACCNPSHLRPGTQAENIMDARSKGRMSPPPHPSGEDSPHASLTAVQAAEIRRRYAGGGIFQRELAAEFGVSQNAISALVRGKTWAAL